MSTPDQKPGKSEYQQEVEAILAEPQSGLAQAIYTATGRIHSRATTVFQEGRLAGALFRENQRQIEALSKVEPKKSRFTKFLDKIGF